MRRLTAPRPARVLLTVAALLMAALVPLVAAPASAGGAAPVRVPAVPSGLPAAIERPSPYVASVACDLRNRTGTIRLAQLIKATYGNTYGLVRSCTASTKPSEHYDGRAVDTFFNVRNATQRSNASALLTWLLKPDAAGNAFANARRLGVMYVIWNNKMWSSYRSSEGWRPYSSCATTPSTSYDTTCHRNHIHISLSWEGAMGRTSFWTKRVAGVDWGPCRPADLAWASTYTVANSRRCPDHPAVKAPAGASAVLKSLVPRSGMVLRPGMTGPAVTIAQRALGVSATGTYGSLTTSRVKAFQQAYHLGVSGVLNHPTWRVLLAVKGMR